MKDFELGQFEGKVTQSLANIEEKLDASLGRLDGQELRIRRLEYWKWAIMGASGLVSFGAAKLTQAMLSL